MDDVLGRMFLSLNDCLYEPLPMTCEGSLHICGAVDSMHLVVYDNNNSPDFWYRYYLMNLGASPVFDTAQAVPVNLYDHAIRRPENLASGINPTVSRTGGQTRMFKLIWLR